MTRGIMRMWLRTRRAPSGVRRVRERGDINILAAGMVPALIIAIGLVVDGGGRLQAEDEAEYAADQAARAAAQQIRIDRAQLGLPPEVDPARATQAAADTLDALGVQGGVTAVNGATVSVGTQVTYETTFLTLIGISSLDVSADAEARAVRGIGQEES
ncbi:pilus assembly protein TadG-related protein [Promicromonospora sp. Populi]|uniref:pilus assembly protein TadG-related protein n=1 Tax=Promicromonospora sp. Populi TaxID=3239420 RepID=UPI0034E1CF78